MQGRVLFDPNLDFDSTLAEYESKPDFNLPIPSAPLAEYKDPEHTTDPSERSGSLESHSVSTNQHMDDKIDPRLMFPQSAAQSGPNNVSQSTNTLPGSLELAEPLNVNNASLANSGPHDDLFPLPYPRNDMAVLNHIGSDLAHPQVLVVQHQLDLTQRGSV